MAGLEEAVLYRTLGVEAPVAKRQVRDAELRIYAVMGAEERLLQIAEEAAFSGFLNFESATPVHFGRFRRVREGAVGPKGTESRSGPAAHCPASSAVPLVRGCGSTGLGAGRVRSARSQRM